MEKYLYFRTQATLADDDDSAQSVVFPLSSFLGAFPSADDTFEMRFKPINRIAGGVTDGADFTNADKVVVSLSTNNTFKKVIGDLLKALYKDEGFNSDGANSFVVVADDLANNTKYLVPEVTAVGAITIAAALS